MSSIDPRVMLITGGSGSIGSEIARRAAQAGWAVAVHGRSAESVAAAVLSVRSHAPEARTTGHRADFSKPGTIAALVAEVAAEHGRIDAVIDCAVTGPPGVTGLFAETDPQAFAAMAEQSVVAFQRLAHATLPWLSRAGGCLVALVSDAGIFAAPRQTMIGAMRAATIGFVRNLALEVAQQGVRVHAISPSFVEDTEVARRLAAGSAERMAQARRRAGLGLPTPTDIAQLALFLCGPGARRMTGQVISINGGLNT